MTIKSNHIIDCTTAVRTGIVRFYCHRHKIPPRNVDRETVPTMRIRLTSELLKYLGRSPMVLMNH